MRRRRGKRGKGKFLFIFLLLAIVVGGGYIYTADEFEREKPTIHSKQNLFWNKKEPLKVDLKDNFGLKSYKLILSDGTNSVVIKDGKFNEKIKATRLLINYPKTDILNSKATKFRLIVSVTDSSMWNMFLGNSIEKVINVNIDYKRPNINILSHSYSITQGGTALVVFQVQDKNLDKVYIKVGKDIFRPQPYKKDGYYASLLVWRFNIDSFNPKIVAIDSAKNKRVIDIPFYLKKHRYKVSWIQAKDKFIDGKITDLASSNPDYANIDDGLERLKSINETMRLKNEDLIHNVSKSVSRDILKSWNIKKFYPLKNGQRVASFGSYRHYYYNDKEKEVSHSFHLGYDLASTKMASIRTSNIGKVVYSSDNGIYGQMPMIDHGLGLYSIYGHCSQILVNEGDIVKANDIIAKSGTSGLALGDHLHFGILVQGVEVRPVEWFDGSWIRKNISNVFKEADKIILDK